MDDNVLQTTISQLVQASPEGLHFYWHGGEPLLAGLGFYEKVVTVQEQTAQQNCRIKNSIQTNGTLLNQEYRFF
jgi:sulfatase maturation enzyme AslB (radical SAM superfamily)